LATLHVMVGLPFSGKTTKAKKLEHKYNALLLTSDILHQKLFGNTVNLKQHNKTDHEKIKNAVELIMQEHASKILALGVDVILDFGFCSRAERDLYRQKAKEMNADFKIHYMDVPVNELYKRLEKQNKKSPSKVTDGSCPLSREELDRYISSFQPPSAEELKE